MLFNSFEFVLYFLPIVLIIYFSINKWGNFIAGKTFLVLASLFFYSWWDVKYLSLILISMLFNYSIGKQIQDRKSKKILIFGISFNLLLLGYFKYANFFLDNMNVLFSTNVPMKNIVLPLAISFFTFQQIAYIVDCYKKGLKERNPLDFMLFVTFFPQLIAGPIVHHNQTIPQFIEENGKLKFENLLKGILVFSLGLFKKVMIADNLSRYVAFGFDQTIPLNFIESWVTSLCYTLQLYFDFSGYTDMAIGVAIMFNVKLPINFNSPYKALSIQDFWRRWHITLSHFLRDYIYIPLGGNKKNESRTYFNVFMTFLLGGLWHGAGWTFIFWGALHGIGVSINRAWASRGVKLNKWISWFITFNFVNFTWIFFRANTFVDAVRIIKGMFGLNGIVLPNFLFGIIPSMEGIIFKPTALILYQIHGTFMTIAFLIILLAMVIFAKNSNELKVKGQITQLTFYAILFAFGLTNLFDAGEFLYFNF